MRSGLVLVMLAAARAEAGDCADTGLVPSVLTPANTTLDQQGGVVVGLVDAPSARTKLDFAKTWQFHSGKARTAATITMLAPGLAVYAPTNPEGSLDLEDDKQKVLVHLRYEMTAYDDMPIDPPPKIASASFKVEVSKRSTIETTTLALGAPVPTGAVAIVAYAVTDGRLGPAKSWVKVAAGATTIELWHAQPCRGSAPGASGARRGETLMLEYIDARGHRSQASPPVTAK